MFASVLFKLVAIRERTFKKREDQRFIFKKYNNYDH